MKVKEIPILKKIIIEFSIEIDKVNKNLNVFVRFEFRSVYNNIDLFRIHFDLIFVYQELQEFNFFNKKLTFFKINI